jgi:hypothetical protein
MAAKSQLDLRISKMAVKTLSLSVEEKRAFGLVGASAVLWWLAYRSLHPFADFVTSDVLGLDQESHLGSSVNFFFYDVPKILLLLSGMIFLITLLRTFITPEQTRRWLGGKREGVGNVLASLLGVITPFCSCSAVPLFIGFVESGVPLGVTFSFLVTAPMVNEVALVMLLGMFGWKTALLYMASGITVAVLSGIIIGRMRMESYVEDFVYQVKVKHSGTSLEARLSWYDRFLQAFDSTREIVGKVWLFVVAGIAVGAGIHGYVPDDFLADVMGQGTWWTVPAAVLLGVPMYSNAAGIMPVVSVLMDKGAAAGTVLAFMMSVVGLSLPEMIILRRVLKPRLITFYVLILTAGIILIGYLFNLVL